MKIDLKLISCFALVAWTSANAELISKDWLAEGDGLLTYDTESMLYWLDVDYTNSGNVLDVARENTFDAVESRMLDPGDSLYGFRHATAFEVNKLFLNAGLNVSSERVWQSDIDATPVETNQFFSLVGATRITSYKTMLNGFTSTYCYELPEEPYCTATSDNKVVIPGVSLDSNNRTYAILVNDKTYTTQYKYYTGHFLVSTNNPSQLASTSDTPDSK